MCVLIVGLCILVSGLDVCLMVSKKEFTTADERKLADQEQMEYLTKRSQERKYRWRSGRGVGIFLSLSLSMVNVFPPAWSGIRYSD